MFQEISGNVRHLLAQLHEAVEAREKGGFGAARRIVETDVEQNEMLRLRAQIEAIQQTLRAEITREASQSKLRSIHTLEAAGIVGGLVLALAFAAYHLLAWDLRQRRWLAGELERRANHDSLTQLPNRRMFEEWLGYALGQARRDGTHLAVMFIDIDGFKAVNDCHGHKAGDALLVEIAKRFRGTARESDFLARVGGDEFALIAPNAKDGRALTVLAQRLVRVLNDPRRPPLSDVPVGASIGIAFFPDDAADVRSLVAAADEAMYAAKRSGKGRIAFHATAVAPVAAISPLAAVA